MEQTTKFNSNDDQCTAPFEEDISPNEKMLEYDGDSERGHELNESHSDASTTRLSPACAIVSRTREGIVDFFRTNRKVIKLVLIGIAVLLFLMYLLAACILDLQRALPLVYTTAAAIIILFYQIFKFTLADSLRNKLCLPLRALLSRRWMVIQGVTIIALVLMVIVLVVVLIGNRPKQYIGLTGLAFFVIVLFLSSHNPAQVRWRPVLSGMLLNFIFALLILKTQVGLNVFQFVAEQVTKFLGYTDVGASFMFGRDTNTYTKPFAFSVLPTVVFFSCVISLLYYIGVMQVVIDKIAFVMQMTMGTSATESLSCAGNIFVGQTEAPILIRPFLPYMTDSELVAVMTGGFATIAGGVLAAYIGMKIDPLHLICASVMNAPMALAVSKLTYPETEKPTYMRGNSIKFEKPVEQNFIEAAAAGASQSIGLVANIAANLVAFLSLLAFINAALSWLGAMVDYPQLSFELLCSYIFWPIPLLMGVDPEECRMVAELIGTKIFLNEFIAYERLGDFIKNRKACIEPFISKRAEVIATYALCGFANLSSIGIQLGGIGAMAPSRRSDLSRLVLRALFAGTVTTLMTASLAGMLFIDPSDELMCTGNSTLSSFGNGSLPINGTIPLFNATSDL